MKRLITASVLLTLLAAGCASAQNHTVFLVRHAEKATDQGDDPALTAEGHSRALRLAVALKPANPAAIFSTQFKRTQQTAKPLADALSLPVTVIETSKEHASQYPNLLLERICALPNGASAVVVGHSNTIPGIVEAWTLAPVRPIADNEHDRLFMVKLDKCQATGSLDLRY
jgi:phosphohistidine phosphatase SixA